METNKNETEDRCCFCGKPESEMGVFKARVDLDGALICSGFCQIGLDVDNSHTDDWR